MLCHICETFLTNFLLQDFTTWRRIKDVEEKWFTYKHGNHETVTAAAIAGCELCALFNQVRDELIPNYAGLGVKWHTQPASIDVKLDKDHDSRAGGSKWSFQLLTVGPEMSWIPFEIFRPAQSYRDHNSIDPDMQVWPREVSECAASAESIALANSWIRDCLSSHSICTRPELTPLPTRVIDLGSSDNPGNPKLYVTQGRRGRYVTLSHCWGIGYRVTLTKNNIHKFEEGIVLNKLPKTFQDAIQIARLLGVRYLWIDALCIIQDDKNDWRRESASMCSVFENAVFSLSGISATDSHSGMLLDRRPHQTKTEINGTRVGVRMKLDTLSEAMMASRLETRAWCYQEGLLPKAILHIAPSQMYWQCNTHIVSETFPSDQSTAQVGNGLDMQIIGAISFSQDWLRLVSAYSARQVTRASDRLPAIAGLADKAKQELQQSIYLQGLWSHDLHAGLLWKRQLVAHGKLIPSRDKYFARSTASSGERPRRPIAPSFSWAATNDAVEYATDENRLKRSITKFDAKFIIPMPTEEKEDHHSKVLQVEALVKRGICRMKYQSSSKPDETSFKPSGSLLADDGLRCYLDYVDDPVSKTCYCIRVANWKQPSNLPKKKEYDDFEQAFYLLFERVQHKLLDSTSETDCFGAFRRIGMGFDIPRKADKIFANAERRFLQLV